MSYLLIQKDGKTIDHRKYKLELLSFRPQSMDHQHEFETVEGRHGSIHRGTTYGPRELKATFLLRGADYLQLRLLITEIHRIFATTKEVYLIHSDQPGKRWRALTNIIFDTEFLTSRTTSFDLDFISPHPFAESIGTTLDAFSPNTGLWGMGMNLPMGVNLIYRHKTNAFKIYNPSDVVLTPNDFPMKIYFKGVSNGLKIKNVTTGQVWQYSGTTKASDVITLDRKRHLKNGVSIYGETSRNHLDINPGYNSFTAEGAVEGFELWFEFHFYYYS